MRSLAGGVLPYTLCNVTHQCLSTAVGRQTGRNTATHYIGAGHIDSATAVQECIEDKVSEKQRLRLQWGREPRG